MTVIKAGNTNLTDPQGLSQAAQHTHQGQAYFGETGPKGKTCIGCTRWVIQGNKNKAYHGKRVCAKGTGHPVPGYALACKHFDPCPDDGSPA